MDAGLRSQGQAEVKNRGSPQGGVRTTVDSPAGESPRREEERREKGEKERREEGGKGRREKRRGF